MKPKKPDTRIPILDQLRGVAIIWMVIFHSAFYFSMFELIDTDLQQWGWKISPKIIIFIFLFCVGASAQVTHQSKINWKKFWPRFTKIVLGAIYMSVLSYLAMPDVWIFFGTLHCIAAGSLLSLLFVNRPKLSLLAFVTILVLQFGFSYDLEYVNNFGALKDMSSMDFIPIYPWFWVILLGIISTPYLKKHLNILSSIKIPILSQLSQHSLKIYLIHHPVLFGISYSLFHFT